MIIISSLEFRENQEKYFDLIDNNEQIIVQRGKNKSYEIKPVLEGKTLMTEEEFFAKIDLSIKQFENGEYITISTPEELKNLLGL